MCKIDVKECCYYNYDNKPYCCELYDNECEAQNCYYKQLQQLKAENEELKEMNHNLSEKFANVCGGCFEQELREKYKNALDDIEKYIYTDCEYNDGCDKGFCIKCRYSSIHDKRILQLIKQAKEDRE